MLVPPAGIRPDGSADPNWLNPRLERERKAERERVLKELGVTDEAAAKTAIAAAQKAADDAKSTGDKLVDAETKRVAAEQEATRLRQATAEYATIQMAALSAEQQEAIRAISPDTDPAGQLRAISALSKTWGVRAPTGATGPAGTTGATAAPAPPASGTAPPPNAPPQNGNVSPPNRKAEYEQLKKTNPHAASLYLNKYSAEIYPRS